MLSCNCNIKNSENKDWKCQSPIPPWKCPHNTLNTSKTFFRDQKTAAYLKKHNITLGIILLFTPLFPLSFYFFANAKSIKHCNKNIFKRVY